MRNTPAPRFCRRHPTDHGPSRHRAVCRRLRRDTVHPALARHRHHVLDLGRHDESAFDGVRPSRRLSLRRADRRRDFRRPGPFARARPLQSETRSAATGRAHRADDRFDRVRLESRGRVAGLGSSDESPPADIRRDRRFAHQAASSDPCRHHRVVGRIFRIEGRPVHISRRRRRTRFRARWISFGEQFDRSCHPDVDSAHLVFFHAGAESMDQMGAGDRRRAVRRCSARDAVARSLSRIACWHRSRVHHHGTQAARSFAFLCWNLGAGY